VRFGIELFNGVLKDLLHAHHGVRHERNDGEPDDGRQIGSDGRCGPADKKTEYGNNQNRGDEY